MTAISSVGAPTAAATGTTETAKTGLNADFNMFLKLLTTQMQNQDPLDPMDTAQYTQQLVQYSQVEQSIEQTSTLKSILAGLSTQDLTQSSGLIGRQAVFDTATAGLSADTPASWEYSASRGLSSVTATITDMNGRTIDTRTIPASGNSGSFEWDGKLGNGAKAPAGSYMVSFAGVDSSGGEVAVTTASTGMVKDVRMENGTVTLNVNGALLPASSLKRIG